MGSLLLFTLVSVPQTHGITIQCDFIMITWPVIGLQYFCSPTIADGDELVLLNVTGVHLKGKSNDDVKALDFYLPLPHSRIPKGIEKFFPNLIGFQWNSRNLETFTSNDIKPFPELQVLSIWGNKLISLDGDSFKHTPKLVFVQFSANLLEHVGYDLLQELNDLTYVYFSFNPCIDMLAETPESIAKLKVKLQIQCPQN